LLSLKPEDRFCLSTYMHNDSRTATWHWRLAAEESPRVSEALDAAETAFVQRRSAHEIAVAMRNALGDHARASPSALSDTGASGASSWGANHTPPRRTSSITGRSTSNGGGSSSDIMRRHSNLPAPLRASPPSPVFGNSGEHLPPTAHAHLNGSATTSGSVSDSSLLHSRSRNGTDELPRVPSGGNLLRSGSTSSEPSARAARHTSTAPGAVERVSIAEARSSVPRSSFRRSDRLKSQSYNDDIGALVADVPVDAAHDMDDAASD
jgi:hypothetical protein